MISNACPPNQNGRLAVSMRLFSGENPGTISHRSRQAKAGPDDQPLGARKQAHAGCNNRKCHPCKPNPDQIQITRSNKPHPSPLSLSLAIPHPITPQYPMTFTPHPRLAASGPLIGIVRNCHLYLKNNACFPWIIIVPEAPESAIDLHHLDPQRYHEIMQTVREVSLFMESFFNKEKLNFGCIGNQVRQLHLHLIARSSNDPAWPGVVWSSDAKQPYDPESMEKIITAARSFLISREQASP
jgi:diadenosine tetraphosphate (Ap4A) HIT family hydrolase